VKAVVRAVSSVAPVRQAMRADCPSTAAVTSPDSKRSCCSRTARSNRIEPERHGFRRSNGTALAIAA